MKPYLLTGLLFCFYGAGVYAEEVDCDKAANTLEINYCAGQKVAQAEQQMQTYLAKSKSRHASDPEFITALDASQQAWQQYADAHCSAIYSYWREGSIRGVMHASCMEKVTKQRTHELWSNYLTYMDSTPPVLPEPK